MKFTIKRDLLLSNLNCVTRALSSKTPMPVLSGIKINVKKNELILTVSNSDISIQCSIKKSANLIIEEEGNVVLPGKYFLEVVRKQESEDIEIITFEDTTVKLLAGSSNCTLNMLDYATYPMISFEESDTHIMLDVLNLKQLIRKTAFATSTSESRAILTGVDFVAEGNRLEAVATDSYRVARKFITFNFDYPKISVVIPSKSLEELNKIIEEGEDFVDIHFSRTKALFKYKNILFQTRLIDGVYPKIDQLIPKDFLTEITFKRDQLISVIERVSLFDSLETGNTVKFVMNDAGIITVSSITNQIGEIIENIDAVSISVNCSLNLAFNSKQFLDGIKSFDSPEITISFTGEIKPFIITGPFDYNQLHLILPVRAL